MKIDLFTSNLTADRFAYRVKAEPHCLRSRRVALRSRLHRAKTALALSHRVWDEIKNFEAVRVLGCLGRRYYPYDPAPQLYAKADPDDGIGERWAATII